MRALKPQAIMRSFLEPRHRNPDPVAAASSMVGIPSGGR